MSQHEFSEQAKIHFHYLIDEYGFAVTEERYDPEAFGNSLVRFHSRDVDVIIGLDRGQVLIDFSPHGVAAGDQFGLPSIVSFLASEAAEPTYVFPETWDNYDDMIEWQLARLARLLRQSCVPVLRGGFSDWKAIGDLRKSEAEEAYRSIAGKEPIRQGECGSNCLSCQVWIPVSEPGCGARPLGRAPWHSG